MVEKTPQLENGYTRIANELLDAIISTNLTKRECLILLAIIRKTYGFNKKEDDITVSQLSFMTNISRPNASRTLNGMVRRNILTMRDGIYGRLIGINKKYWEWDDRTKTIPRREILERDNWQCQLCGIDTPEHKSGMFVEDAPEVDHIIEIADGGNESAENLRTLCRKCHYLKTQNSANKRQRNSKNGHESVPEETRKRVERDTPNQNNETLGVPIETRQPCQKGHGDRIPTGTLTVSKGTHTKDNPKRQSQKTTPKESCGGAKTPTAEVWNAYSTAYFQRYGVNPIRNAKVNGQLSQLLSRIPKDEAPHVASFFLRHNNSFYVQKGHPVGLLLADAEKLRTEWITNRQVTQAQARQADKTQSTVNVFEKLKGEANERSN